MKPWKAQSTLLLAVALLFIGNGCSNVTEMRDETAQTKPQMQPIPVSIADRRQLEEVIVTARVAKEPMPVLSKPAPAPLLLAERVLAERGENYAAYDINGIQQAKANPISTFSIDVDTGSYSNVRRFLNMGQLPPKDAVRVEEMINYFSYDYAVPSSTEQPFSVSTELAESPWNRGKHLMRVGLKGYEVEKRQPANLVFLIDVSGSMQSSDKIGLIKPALRMLARHSTEEDTVGIVTYAGQAGVLLAPVKGDEREKIDAAIAGLAAGGSTYGQGGLIEAYKLAREHFRKDAINRVILLTDGDFNVGISDVNQLKKYVADQREHGIGLTALGFGSGNYNDEMLEQLADIGNGNYAYIDNLSEARRVLVEQASATLQTIASDVKIQIEFNPAVVAEYRLVGYENRLLNAEDFNNDKVDAGDIGAGHTVTALYEIALVGSQGLAIDELRYQPETRSSQPGAGDEVAFVKLRYKRPGETASQLISQPIHVDGIKKLGEASKDFRFAAAVAAFGQLLAGTGYIEMDYDGIIEMLKGTAGGNYRSEFVNLVGLASEISTPLASR